MKYEKKEVGFTLEVEALNHNLKRVSLMNKIYMTVLVTIIIIIYTMEMVPSIQYNSQESIGWIQYFILLIIHLIYVYLLDIRKIKVTESNYKPNKLLLHSFLAFSLNISAFLPIHSHNLIHPIFLYTIILFSSIPFLVSKSKEILILLSVSSIILLLELGMLYGNEANFPFQALYIFTLLTLSFLISKSTYIDYFDSQELRFEKEKEVQYLQNLNELLKEANRQLEKEATLDPLTNLYNRRAYNAYLIELQQSILESPQSISVIMVDVDCFKLYNDTYGHFEGDIVLSKIGRLLHEISMEYQCFAGRWGGEEFVLILPNVIEEIVQNICYQIKEGVSELNIEHQSSTIDTVVTVSIGACTKMIMELNEIFECISEADEALYAVKENGRNSFEYRHQIHVL
ncbi:diguanylate cyclase [Lysinibacillus sp. SGAir0095]|uniref:GGDEF domain-containing protein n=1 Tax=Lysinibacillus sp. SGAir0095 TaxID=2070463 RepID=UPI0010CD294F|nr:diguanylate cyclase [Lysinibacillus sp. SGAir0095]QCR32373.1 hypothetical protein C1N55_09370 [Lysinibacillus sp. SGAir0095]